MRFTMCILIYINEENPLNRPALKKLLKDADERKFDCVLVWSINRIGKSIKDVLNIVNLLDRNNISFKSVTELIDTTTAKDKMTFQMMRLITEFENSNTVNGL